MEDVSAYAHGKNRSTRSHTRNACSHFKTLRVIAQSAFLGLKTVQECIFHLLTPISKNDMIQENRQSNG